MADLAKVDKVIIAQDSIQHFIDSVSPGAYESITKVNFKALDRFMIKPLGVYGPKDEIIRLLVHGRHRRRCVSAISANYYPVLNFFIRACLLLAPADYGDSQPMLSSGLYTVRANPSDLADGRYFVVYWPEDTTWNDSATSSVRRNRVTFTR